MNTITPVQDKGSMIEQVLIKGDLSSLSPEQRSSYYMKVCDSVGLNMLTKPFEYITLNGKLTLYALRSCTDQLRSVHKVSVEELVETEREGVFIVTAKVKNGEGRTDIAKGAVNIAGLKGEALANALMKAETKAKRRATLSICGLGMLDETEVETIPGATRVDGTPVVKEENKPSIFKNAALRNTFVKNVIESFKNEKTLEGLKIVASVNKAKIEEMEAGGNNHDLLAVDEMRKQLQISQQRLKQPEEAYEEEVPAYLRQQIEEENERLGALEF